jgi:hypothetical protein
VSSKDKEDRSEIESGKKGIRALSIASGDTSPLLKPPKYMLYKMALLILLFVISPYHLPTTLGRNNYPLLANKTFTDTPALRAAHTRNPPLAPLKL